MKDEMISKNTGLIYSVIRKLNLYNRVDEFFDIGMIGLVKGVNNYNESLGYKPSTYLYRCIYNEIIMSFRKLNSGREIPEFMKLSLSTKVFDNIELQDTIVDDLDVEETLIEKERYENLYAAISKLPEKEQLIINMYYGLNGYKETTQKDIAQLFNTTQSYISKIKLKSLKKLKDMLPDEENL